MTNSEIVRKDLKKSMRKKNPFKSQWGFWVLVTPLLIYTLFFKYLPMGGVLLAFKNYKYNLGFLGSPWVGLKNFNFFFSSPDFWRITRNTVGYNLIFLVLNAVVPVILALLLFELKNRIALKFYQTTMFFPNFISWIVVAFMGYAFLNPQYGILNRFLVGHGFNNIDWYSKPQYWPFIIIISNTWKTFGMNTLMYYSALMGIDSELFEAAMIEGAGKYKIMTKITLPHLIPLMAILFILGIGSIFSADFGLFYQMPMNSTLLYETTDVVDTYIFRALKEQGNIGMSSAVDFYKSFLGLVMVLLSNFTCKKIDPEYSLF